MKKGILIPSYYEQFSCIGSACEDTCCAGWRVTVDKQSFNNYRKITSGPLAADLKANISRNRKNPSDFNYGTLKMDENKRCTFLQLDGLCKIYKELGAQSLCSTCATYPRHVVQIENRIEKSQAVSCPEATRLVLLNPDGIDFIVAKEDIKATSKKYQKREIHDYFWAIRMFTIHILQTRHASLEEGARFISLFPQPVSQDPKEQELNEHRHQLLLNKLSQIEKQVNKNVIAIANNKEAIKQSAVKSEQDNKKV